MVVEVGADGATVRLLGVKGVILDCNHGWCKACPVVGGKHLEVVPFNIDIHKINLRAGRHMLSKNFCKREYGHRLCGELHQPFFGAEFLRNRGRKGVDRRVGEAVVGEQPLAGADTTHQVGVAAACLGKSLHRLRVRVDVDAAPAALVEERGVRVAPRVVCTNVDVEAVWRAQHAPQDHILAKLRVVMVFKSAHERIFYLNHAHALPGRDVLPDTLNVWSHSVPTVYTSRLVWYSPAYMAYTRYLRWALLLGLALVFFVPFIVADGTTLFPDMFFPFITGKNFAFRILIELLLGVYVLLAVREPKYRPHASNLLWTAVAFVAWVGVATIFSVDPIKSFWSNFERMEGYITVLHLFAYFVIAGAVVTAERWWERLFQVSIFSSAVMGSYAVLQLAGKLPISSQSGTRVDTTFGNATYLAVFMLFNIFITLFMLVRQRRSAVAQALLGVALVLQVVTLYYTQTRGALLGVLGGLIIAALYIALRGAGREWRSLRQVAVGGLLLIGVLIGGFLAVRNTSLVQHSPTLARLASISVTDRTTTSRFQIWGMAYQGFKEKPVVGWGQENFNFVFNKYYTPAMYDQEQWFDRAHNQFIDWLIAAGLPAFLLYVSFFAFAAWAIIRADALEVPEQALFLGLLAAYAFNNLFVFDDLMSSVYFFTVLAFAHGVSSKKLPGKLFLSRPGSDQLVAILAPVVVVAVVVGGWALNAPGIARAENLIGALMTQTPVSNGSGGVVGAPKDPKINVAQFAAVLGSPVWPGTPLGTQETTEQLLQFASSAVGSSSVDPSTKQSAFVLAQGAAQSLLAQRQHDARLELFLGAFYDAAGQFTQAQNTIKQALSDSPKKQQIMFEEGVSYLNAGDTKDALPVLQHAFAEAPQYRDARILYAAGLYYAGDSTDADALLQQGFGTTTVDDARLLQVYTSTKQYGRAIAIWQLRIQNDSTNPQMHVGLASVYFAAGNKQGAISELQRAAQLSPTLATQIQGIITQIQNGTLK